MNKQEILKTIKISRAITSTALPLFNGTTAEFQVRVMAMTAIAVLKTIHYNSRYSNDDGYLSFLRSSFEKEFDNIFNLK